MEVCPDCSTRLQNERDECLTIKTNDGPKTRWLRTYFYFGCGAVWIKNDDYPKGIKDISCTKTTGKT